MDLLRYIHNYALHPHVDTYNYIGTALMFTLTQETVATSTDTDLIKYRYYTMTRSNVAQNIDYGLIE